MESGIYRIRNAENGKCYIGSAISFAKRWNVHRCLLRKGKHHSPHLQAAWNKHGEESFSFEELLYCSKENLIFFEQRAIDTYRAFDRDHGYNATPKAESTLGRKNSEETRAKLRAARAKQVFSEETRAKLSASAKGRKMPAWFSEFASRMHKGRKCTPEQRERIGASQRGKPHTLKRIESRAPKLNGEKAREIRALLTAGKSQAEIAGTFGIHQSMVSLIASGKRWSAA